MTTVTTMRLKMKITMMISQIMRIIMKIMITNMMRITTMKKIMMMKTMMMKTTEVVEVPEEAEEEALTAATSKETAREDLLPVTEAAAVEIPAVVPVEVPDPVVMVDQEEEEAQIQEGELQEEVSLL